MSSYTYWKTRLLAQAGVKFFIVTNANQAPKHHRLLWKLEKSYKNIEVRYLSDNNEAMIPHSNAYVTRLANIGCEIIENNQIDLIEANYLEPNGLAAFLVSQWFNIPYGIKHAGSDVGRLLDNSEYKSTYKRILKNASYIVTGGKSVNKFLSMNIPRHQLVKDCVTYPVAEYFNPYGNQIDLNKYAALIQSLSDDILIGSQYYKKLAAKILDKSKPTIGIYGKASLYKGHSELLKALCLLRKKGYQFNLAIVIQGGEKYIADLYKKIYDNQLDENTLLLPFIEASEVPRYIRACDVVCYLENNFPIQNHNTAKIPLEVIYCARHLIISSEAASNQLLQSIKGFKEAVNIVEMNKSNDLYSGLKNYFDNVDSYKQKSLSLYESYCLAPEMSTSEQINKLGRYYKDLFESKCSLTLVKCKT